MSAELGAHAAAARDAGTPLIVGIGGSVAVGKSTFAAGLRDALGTGREPFRVESIATDGFLHPNAVLAARGLSLRKGFPESYDVDAMRVALAGVKARKRVALPRYSHVTYDVDAGDPLTLEAPDVLILDGLHLAQVEREGTPRLIDKLIYLDATEAAIATWFTQRLVPLMEAGRDDPNSFYHRFRDWDDAGRRDFAKRIWDGVNLPNLREHIVRDRDAAEFVVTKNADHSIAAVTRRT
ncbi:MAG TPA: hypothetical protein VGB91_14910 [Rhizomicrobium sp.]